MKKVKAWLQASRLASQSYIFFPLLLGQSCWYAQQKTLDIWILVLVHAYGLCVQLYIVYANDYADTATDRINSTYNLFSGGSRVLVDGLLIPRELLAGIMITVLATILVGAMLWHFAARPFSLLFIAVSLGLLWLYSYKPVQLSYRGGGELLQMLGVGGVLPLFGYYAQAGTVTGFPLMFLAFILPAQLSCALATALPDQPSDRQSGKRTCAVLFGAAATKVIISALNIVSIATCLFVFPRAPLRCVMPSLVCNAFMLMLIPHSPPGSRRLNLFVTCAVASTVLLTAMCAVALLL
ncbi:MAG: prenyltransferase [Desulfobacterota bacterium]|nr:prenyltransferase [Thermodesulfobacteriota bacterium]